MDRLTANGMKDTRDWRALNNRAMASDASAETKRVG